MKISARNQLKGKVVEVRKGQTTAHVRLDVNGMIVTAAITNEAVDELSPEGRPRSVCRCEGLRRDGCRRRVEPRRMVRLNEIRAGEVVARSLPRRPTPGSYSSAASTRPGPTGARLVPAPAYASLKDGGDDDDPQVCDPRRLPSTRP